MPLSYVNKYSVLKFKGCKCIGNQSTECTFDKLSSLMVYCCDFANPHFNFMLLYTVFFCQNLRVAYVRKK